MQKPQLDARALGDSVRVLAQLAAQPHIEGAAILGIGLIVGCRAGDVDWRQVEPLVGRVDARIVETQQARYCTDVCAVKRGAPDLQRDPGRAVWRDMVTQAVLAVPGSAAGPVVTPTRHTSRNTGHNHHSREYGNYRQLDW
jgi:hypothetical protein